MKHLIRKLSALLTALLLTATGAAFAEAAPDATENPSVLGYFEGSILDVSQYEGKAIYLNFFTSWCTYCMQEMPDVKKLAESYDPEQLAVILVHVCDGEDASASDAVVEKYGLESITLLQDEDGALASLVGVPGYPTSLFIDKDGKLTAGVASMLTYEGMASYVEQMGVAPLEAVKE